MEQVASLMWTMDAKTHERAVIVGTKGRLGALTTHIWRVHYGFTSVVLLTVPFSFFFVLFCSFRFARRCSQFVLGVSSDPLWVPIYSV